ncbi:MAG: hypothetical protein ABSE49_27010 [Polyangiaceae bacterium]
MRKLTKCPGCTGFVPTSGAACPHCGRAPSRITVGAVAKGLACIAAGGAVSLTLMACYGPAPRDIHPGPPSAPSGGDATPAPTSSTR